MSTDAIIYLRQSDFRDEDAGALDARESELRVLAQLMGLTVIWVARENDLDGNGTLRGASAYKATRRVITRDGLHTWRTNRPRFAQVCRRLQDGDGLTLLVSDDSRISRDERDGRDLLDACASGRASVVALDDEGEPRTILANGGSPAQRDAFLDRIRDARRYSADVGAKVRKGRRRWAGKSYQGGRPGFGFRVVDGTAEHARTLVADPAEAAEIVKAATALLRGVSLKAVIRDLNQRGVPTVSERIAREKGQPGTGALWESRTLRDVLLKPGTAGLAVLRGQIVGDAPWAPILDRPTWDRLHVLLDDPARRTTTGHEPRWLVSCFATCGVCGRTVSVGRNGGKGNRQPAYVGKVCGHVTRNAVAVDHLVAEAVIGWLERYADSQRLRPAPRADGEAKGLRAEQRRLAKRRDQFRALAASGDMDPADVAAMLRTINADLDRVASHLAGLVDEVDPIEDMRSNPRQAWEAATLPRRRAVVQAVLSGVVLERATRRGRGFDPDSITLVWHPAAMPAAA